MRPLLGFCSGLAEKFEYGKNEVYGFLEFY